jgi:hypothetical protein
VKGGCPIRSRSVWSTASSLAAALLLASCGGGGDGETATAEDAAAPAIPSAIALDLADRSEAVAQLLDSGDHCGAAEEAAKLRQAVTDAINAQQIPQAYLEDLQGVTNELEQAVPVCTKPPPPPPPPTTTEEEEGDA